jgi:hypothetical protein
MEFSGTAKGRFMLDNVSKFTALEPGTKLSGTVEADLSFSGSKEAVDKKQYEEIKTSGDIRFTKIHYASKDYPDGFQINKATIAVSPAKILLNELSADYLNTRFSALGSLENIIGYALKDEMLTGTLNVSADIMNLNKWMGNETGSSTDSLSASASDPFTVPANLFITLNASAEEVEYDQVRYKNVRGTLILKDEAVHLQDIYTEALGGSMTMNGSYATKKDKKNPDIALSYDLKEIDIQKAFKAFNTVQKLTPIAQFLSGKLSSQLNVTGKLNGDLMPDMNSLTGKGNMLVLEGVLNQFAPLEKLANTLQIADLKSISLEDIRSHIEFSHGKVLVKPFDVKVKDIEMQIGGMHGFDQSMDYIIAMKLPRSYLGEKGNALVNNLSSQAAGKGIPVQLGETVNLNVRMGGSFTSPVIATDLKSAGNDMQKELKQQAASFVQQKADSARKTVKDSLQSVKKQVTNDVKNEIAKQVFGTKDSASTGKPLGDSKKKAEETLKNTFGNLLKNKKKGNTDSTRN